jgi:hypothetical protein
VPLLDRKHGIKGLSNVDESAKRKERGAKRRPYAVVVAITIISGEITVTVV